MGLLNLRSLFEDIEQPAPPAAREPRAAAVGSLMAATRRELAVLAAEMMGAQTYLGQFGLGDGSHGPLRADRRLFRDLIENATLPSMIIDPRPGLHIIDINDTYAAATLTSRRQAAGGKLFEVFPDNPELSDADGVGNLYESIRKASQSGRIHTMAVQRYDVQDASGRFVEKYWQPVNTPICDETGRLVFVLHHVIDVTPR